MKLYIVGLYLFVITACYESPKAKTCRLGDVIRFKFSERNLFYSDICNDYGEVVDVSYYDKHSKYLLHIKCNNRPSWSTFPEGVWVDAEDIIDVIRLGKDKYKKGDAK